MGKKQMHDVATTIEGIVGFVLDRNQDNEELEEEIYEMVMNLIGPVVGNRSDNISDEDCCRCLIKVMEWGICRLKTQIEIGK